MRFLIINPNTTPSMTEKIGAAAENAACKGTAILATNPVSGPASIEGFYDEAFAVPGILAEIGKVPDMDAYIIACFDDTGLDAARCATRAPVIGIGEAAFHMASLIAVKFSVVTTLARSVPIIEHNLAKYGLANRCARIRASEIPVLDLDQPNSSARERICDEILKAREEDAAEAIVLGCAGMVDLADQLSHQTSVPIIEGVTCAVKLAEAAVGLKLRTSPLGGYAPPRPKEYIGDFSAYAPR